MGSTWRSERLSWARVAQLSCNHVPYLLLTCDTAVLIKSRDDLETTPTMPTAGMRTCCTKCIGEREKQNRPPRIVAPHQPPDTSRASTGAFSSPANRARVALQYSQTRLPSRAMFSRYKFTDGHTERKPSPGTRRLSAPYLSSLHHWHLSLVKPASGLRPVLHLLGSIDCPTCESQSCSRT